MHARRRLANSLLALAWRCSGVAWWLDPVPLPPGCDERMRARFALAIGRDATKGNGNGNGGTGQRAGHGGQGGAA